MLTRIGLVRIKDTEDFSAQCIKRFKLLYVTTTVCAPMLDSSHIYWYDFFHVHTGNCLINALSGVISSYTLTPIYPLSSL